MNPKQIWGNLATTNLERTVSFYTALGFKQTGPPDQKLVAFNFGETNFVICFLLKDVLAGSTKSEMADTTKVNEVVFSISCTGPEEADKWAKEVGPAGGKLITQPEAFGPGYYGFVFADPDGHRFNVFYMPGFEK